MRAPTWWGFDPGRQIGVAHVAVGEQITVRCSFTANQVTLATNKLPHPGPALRGVALEGWEYQGAARARGVPPQAEAYGRLAGVLEHLGYAPVTVRRTDILRALGLPRNASKRAVREWLARLVVCAPGARPANHHEWDAVAVAIVAANRADSC